VVAVSEKPTPEFVTNRELAAELRSMRWEVRCLIAAAAVANLTLAYGLKLPPVPQAVHILLNLF
jgi:hypothetical protein